MTAAVHPTEIRWNEKHPKAEGNICFLLTLQQGLTSKPLESRHVMDYSFLSFRTGVGPKKGRVSPLLIQHVSDCWMTERWCRALWLSGLDPDGRRWGGAKKRWSQVCDKSWFPPILPNHPHRPSLFQLFPPFKVWLWMSQWQIIAPPQGRAGSHGRKRSRAWLGSLYF